jgi:hypothetical protein
MAIRLATLKFVYFRNKFKLFIRKMSESVGEAAVENNCEKALSAFQIEVTTLTSSSVVLTWKYASLISTSERELVFKLLKLETRDEWKAIAWTRKMTCTIKNLEQNVCYSLQILVLVEDEEEFKVVDESGIFKVSICLAEIRENLEKLFL